MRVVSWKMPSRRAIKGVLDNFLGTFTSRYSDLGGYWLFGFLIENIEQIRTDLLAADSTVSDTTPAAVARGLAATRFAEQIEKAGIPKAWFREARLEAAKMPGTRVGPINGRICCGYEVRFLVKVVTDLGRGYERALPVFVAPHNPAVEIRSTRAS